ncbi:MAG: MnhB domain-containing protein [Candidatus Cloacimonadales bacterium]|nr:MnhB domain-containing protein [Candidatus Cloacimonadales bacterium]
MSIIVKKICQILAPVIFLFGLYVVAHGHLTPGGGFAGGVIMASSFIFQIIAYGSILPKLRHEEHGLEFLESGAILGFLVIAALGLILSGTSIFFAEFLNKGTAGNLISAGFIPIENIVVGAEVCAGISIIFMALAVFKDEVTK